MRCLLSLALCLHIASAGAYSPTQKRAFLRPLRTVGIYIPQPKVTEERLYDFYRACGYNYLELCDVGFSRRPDKLDDYYASFSRAIQQAKRRGFQAWVLLLAGMRQWNGPAEAGNAGTFSALNTGLLEERLVYLRRTVRELKAADGFVFFAGDPGGDPEGRSAIRDCIAFARKVEQIVREEAPGAGMQLNVWAIAEWSGFPSPFSLDFWRKQVRNTEAIVGEPGLLGDRLGIAFSLDSYYRSLTLACFDHGKAPPELYPLNEDVRRLREAGVTPLLGWPYFLVDEVDDGYITPNNVVTKGQAGAETRYIRSIVNHGMQLGLDGLVANAAFPGAELLNIWSFAQMCRNPGLSPTKAIERFARLLATPDTSPHLARALHFLEDHSNWENSLPRQHRLPRLGLTGTASAEDARLALGRVVLRRHPGIVLPEPASEYLRRVRDRIGTIERGEAGGHAPVKL